MPRLDWRVSDAHRLRLDPFVSVTDEDKPKLVEKFKADGSANGTTVEHEDKERTLMRVRGTWDWRINPAHSLNLRASLQEGDEDKDKTKQDFDPAGVGGKLTLEDEKQRGRERGIELQYRYLMGGAHAWLFGSEVLRKSDDTDKRVLEDGVLKAAGPNDRFDIEDDRLIFYAQDEWTVAPGHTLTPGLRHERLDTASLNASNERFSNDDELWLPSLLRLGDAR